MDLLENKLLIVLDIDETLVHATRSSDLTYHDFEVLGYKVVKRPFLDEFLLQLPAHFKVAVWSSASDDYVKEIVKHIFPSDYPLEFVWGRSKCNRKADYKKAEEIGYFDYESHLSYVKKLSKVVKRFSFNMEQILIIDDTPGKAVFNYGNAIYPSEFKGQHDDKELKLLLEYLKSLKEVTNVRAIEKRFWKSTLLK